MSIDESAIEEELRNRMSTVLELIAEHQPTEDGDIIEDEIIDDDVIEEEVIEVTTTTTIACCRCGVFVVIIIYGCRTVGYRSGDCGPTAPSPSQSYHATYHSTTTSSIGEQEVDFERLES
jgi:hypothetical protein